MADVEVDVDITDVQYTAWLRTSYIASVVVSDSGKPMIEQLELGLDQRDALKNFLTESTRQVLKVFMSRQGDVTGEPFEYDESNAIYRFNEALPLLPQAAAIKSTLYEDTKNAIYTYATFLWFQIKGKKEQADYLMMKYELLATNINRHLYKLHD